MQYLDLKMIAEGRRIVMLIDNFSGHYIAYTPHNICLEYFALNLTAFIQPMDSSVIRTFKAYYRIAMCWHALLLDDASESEIFKFDLFEAIC